MKLRCRQIVEDLAAYRHRALSEHREAEVKRHLEACADCRRVLTSIDDVGDHLRALPRLTPPGQLRERIQERLSSDPGRGSRALSIGFVFAAVVIAVVVAVFVVSTRPRIQLIELDQPAPNESLARTLHSRRLRAELPLTITSSDALTLRTWVVEHLGIYPPFTEPPRPTPHGLITFDGATAASNRRAVLIHMRIGGRPASLLLQPRTGELVGIGTWTKRVFYRKDEATGLKALAWSNRDSTYVLVSDQPGVGQTGCLSCHTNPERRKLILAMHAER